MNEVSLLIGIMLIVWLATTSQLVWRLFAWNSAVSALQLRWDREQRQAAGNVPITQRQDEQARFEELVSSRPAVMVWVHLVLTIGLIALALVLAWDTDNLRWNGLWLVAPLGVGQLILLLVGWMQMHAGASRLSIISTTLYGPAPPRVKVKKVKIEDVIETD